MVTTRKKNPTSRAPRSVLLKASLEEPALPALPLQTLRIQAIELPSRQPR